MNLTLLTKTDNIAIRQLVPQLDQGDKDAGQFGRPLRQGCVAVQTKLGLRLLADVRVQFATHLLRHDGR